MGSSSLIITYLMLLLLRSANGQIIECSSVSHDYTADGAYARNLKSLLSSLVANGSDNGYFASDVGAFPDTAYGVVVCRGDVDASLCRRCLEGAVQEVVERCPNKRGAVLWDDYCFLRYTEHWSFSSIANRSIAYYRMDTGNVTAGDLPLFKEQLERMMSHLAAYAAYNSSRRMFASGEAGFTADGSKIYALAQCTDDLPAEVCERCLNGFISEIPRNSFARKAKMMGEFCYFKYGLHRFYNTSAMVSVPSPVPAPPLPPWFPSDLPTSKDHNLRVGKHLHVTIVVVSIVMGLATVTYISIWRMKALKKTDDPERIPFTRSLQFDLSTLRLATDNFSSSNKLGEGGFGTVYKGILACGQAVAVKRLSTSSRQGLEELSNEVELLAKQEHRNLVRLFGVCLEEEKLLVYEYMPNASLDKFLFDPTKKNQLTWQLRYKILKGVAQGLLYLHEESQCKIIHRDLKASNILLDANMNPKISDFGISRLFPGDRTHVKTSRVVGTFGYMAPEYVINGRFSKKSDVFSFGVLVLEIVTGRRNCSFSDSEGTKNLLSYVWEHWTVGSIHEIFDPSLGDQYQQTEVLRCIQIGLLCVQQAAVDRPTMSSIVLMLDSLATTLAVPLQPAFFPGPFAIGRLPSSINPSLNGLSISDMDPR